ncbi:SpoIID/LytB domain-containing protein [Synechococcus sp. ATX 2A4]|nr:SpoIID/LytB domain-containing protein [Synechococcus sp. ATX 2A4]
MLPLAASASPDPSLRVLLLEAAEVRVGGAHGLRLLDASGRERFRLPEGGALALRTTANGVQVDVVAPAVQGAAPLPAPLRLPEVWIDAVQPTSGDAVLHLQNRTYRGRLVVRPAAVATALRVVNVVALETYLPSVVGSEMPASWPLEALRAQAVAARTYALRQRRPEQPFDLKATVSSQVYKGLEAETPSTREAVRGTRGLVLTHQNALINAVFHSSAGGTTENSGDLWQRQMPYLVSVADFDEASPVSRWRQELPPPLLARAFAELGGVQRIDILSTTASGRVRQARVVGPSGQLLVSGAELRSRLGLRSTLVRFEAAPFSFPDPEVPPSTWLSATGVLLSLPALPPLLPPPNPTLVAVGRGFGHGVGMSQWGALAMAQRGSSFQEILHHYYRGAQLRPYGDIAKTRTAADAGAASGSSPWSPRNAALSSARP